MNYRTLGTSFAAATLVLAISSAPLNASFTYTSVAQGVNATAILSEFTSSSKIDSHNTDITGTTPFDATMHAWLNPTLRADASQSSTYSSTEISFIGSASATAIKNSKAPPPGKTYAYALSTFSASLHVDSPIRYTLTATRTGNGLYDMQLVPEYIFDTYLVQGDPLINEFTSAATGILGPGDYVFGFSVSDYMDASFASGVPSTGAVNIRFEEVPEPSTIAHCLWLLGTFTARHGLRRFRKLRSI